MDGPLLSITIPAVKTLLNISQPHSFMLYLIDSSAVLNDFGFQFLEEHSYVTTPLVIKEFKDLRSRHLMENALKIKLLSIREPKEETMDFVERLVSKKGFSRLSIADLSLLALGFEFRKAGRKFVLITDDYSIQNFCKTLKIPFESVMRGSIKEEIAFSKVCSGCGAQLPPDSMQKLCPECGSKIKQKKRNIN